MNKEIINTLMGMAEIYGKNITPIGATIFLQELSDYPEAEVLAALKKSFKTKKYFPLPSEIADIIAERDGRPSPEEAWALIPKNESDSVVWCDEMREAWGVALDLIDYDKIGARNAFIGKYVQLVKESREKRIPVKWVPSLGYSQSGRDAAMVQALEKNRITLEFAQKHCPAIQYKPKDQVLIGSETDPGDIRRLIAGTFKEIEK